MPPKRTGNVQTFTAKDGSTYLRGRIRLSDGSRQWVDVPARFQKTEDAARAYVLMLQEGEDKSGAFLKEKTARLAKAPVGSPTVAEYATEKWLPERKDRGISSVDTDAGRLKEHVLPVIGGTLLVAVTREDVERVVRVLDKKVRAKSISWKTARNAWAVVTSLFDDAANSKDPALRYRKDNPTEKVRAPDAGDTLAKTFLYPEEFIQLVSCESIPLRWRRMFALAVYMYARAGELAGLEFSKGVDLAHLIVTIETQIDRRDGKRRKTKTKAGKRSVPIENSLTPLLVQMSAEAAVRGIDRVSPIDGTDKKLARQIRRCLEIAGVLRRALHEATDTSAPLTFHDLRATGITWCAVRGDDMYVLRQRAGHEDFDTTLRYIREAENLRRGFGTVFPPLPASLLVQPNDWATYERQQVRKPKKEAESDCGGAGNRSRSQSASNKVEAASFEVSPVFDSGDAGGLGQASPSFGPGLGQPEAASASLLESVAIGLAYLRGIDQDAYLKSLAGTLDPEAVAW